MHFMQLLVIFLTCFPLIHCGGRPELGDCYDNTTFEYNELDIFVNLANVLSDILDGDKNQTSTVVKNEINISLNYSDMNDLSEEETQNNISRENSVENVIPALMNLLAAQNTSMKNQINISLEGDNDHGVFHVNIWIIFVTLGILFLLGNFIMAVVVYTRREKVNRTYTKIEQPTPDETRETFV